MPALKVVASDEGTWFVNRDTATEDMRSRLSDGELSLEYRVHHPGGDDELQMFEVRLGPDVELEAHAHDNDEIILVIGGTLRLGSRTLGPGSSLYIPGSTLYSVKAGADGLHFANFRARKDETYITKAEFMDRRGGRR